MEAKSLGQLLTKEGILSEHDWTTIERACESKPTEIIKGITELGLVEETKLINILAKECGAGVIEGALISHFERDVLEFVDPILMQRLEFVPLKELEDDKILIATSNPLDRSLMHQLQFFTGRRIVPMIASPSQIQDCLEELIEGYEAKESPFRSFLSKFKGSIPAPKTGATALPPEDNQDLFENLAINEDETDLLAGSDDLDLLGLSTIDGDDEHDEVAFDAPHEHTTADDDQELDFGGFGAEAKDSAESSEEGPEQNFEDQNNDLSLEEAASEDTVESPEPENLELSSEDAESNEETIESDLELPDLEEPTEAEEKSEENLAEESAAAEAMAAADDLVHELEAQSDEPEDLAAVAASIDMDKLEVSDEVEPIDQGAVDAILSGEIQTEPAPAQEAPLDQDQISSLLEGTEAEPEAPANEPTSEVEVETLSSEPIDQSDIDSLLGGDPNETASEEISSEPIDQSDIDSLLGGNLASEESTAVAEPALENEESIEVASPVVDQGEIDQLLAVEEPVEETPLEETATDTQMTENPVSVDEVSAEDLHSEEFSSAPLDQSEMDDLLDSAGELEPTELDKDEPSEESTAKELNAKEDTESPDSSIDDLLDADGLDAALSLDDDLGDISLDEDPVQVSDEKAPAPDPITEVLSAEEEKAELETSMPIEIDDIDSALENPADLAAEETAALQQPDKEVSAEAASMEATSEFDKIESTAARMVSDRLIRDVESEAERAKNTEHIGRLNRALMNLKFADEKSEAVKVCHEALSLVFNQGLIFLAGENTSQIVFQWQGSEIKEPQGEGVADGLNEVAKGLVEGWNSEVEVQADWLPWSAKGEIFIFKHSDETLGQVVWISEAAVAENVTTGLAGTCRQIILRFIDFLGELSEG